MGRIKFITHSWGVLFALLTVSVIINRYFPAGILGIPTSDIDNFGVSVWMVYYIICCARRTYHIGWPLPASILAWFPVFNLVFYPAILIIPGKDDKWIPEWPFLQNMLRRLRK